MKNPNDIDRIARELMDKYTRGITVGELLKEIPNDVRRREIFSRMIYLGQCDANEEIFGA